LVQGELGPHLTQCSHAKFHLDPSNRLATIHPGDVVLDWDPAPPRKGGRSPSPIFGPCLLRPNGCMDQDATWYGGRPQPRRHCARWGPRSPPQKGAEPPPPIFGTFLLWPNGWIHQGATWYGSKPVLDGNPARLP